MSAIVLAGQRDGEDALSQYAGVACKAFAAIGGKPMLLRVLDTLAAASCVGPVVLSGPKQQLLQQQHDIRERLRSADLTWLAPRQSPSASTFDALSSLPPAEPVLVTTADHPLLTTGIVDEFCNLSFGQDADVVVGLTPYARVREKFPAMKKTVLRFRGAGLCGCNLFAFLTPASREAARFWQRLERGRKKPMRLIRILGWPTVIRYFLGWLSVEQALFALSKKMGLRIRAVLLSDGNAAVDVDSVSDYKLVAGKFAD